MDNRERAAFWSEGHPLRRTLVILLVLAALGGLIWFAVSLSHSSKAGGGAGGPGGAAGGRGRRPPTTVGVATASISDIPVTLDGLGTVTPPATVTVTPQVSGVITKILFKEGQLVKKGQAIAQIDPRPLQMALLQAQGNETRDAAQLANAKLLLTRDQTLLAQDSIARQDVDTQAALVKQLEGTVMTDQAAVGTAKLNLGYSSVISPVAGRIGLRAVDLGNFMQAGSTTGLAVVTEVSPIDVVFTVAQDAVPNLQAQAAHSQLAVTAYDRTKTVVLDQGVFSTLDNQIDPTTGTVKAKARFPNTNGVLFPSQFVNVRIALQTLHNVVVVPVTAVRSGPQGDFVWILRPDKSVTKRNVTRGPATPLATSITEGLTPGEKVITEGGDRLTEGGKVTLPTDKNPMLICAADMKKLCDGKQGRDAFMCLRQNMAKTSPACKDAMSSASRGGGGGGGGGAGGAASGGGFAMTPEMQAAREAMHKACDPDTKKLCPGLEGREANACLRENSTKATAACQAALAKMPSRSAGGGGGGAASGAGGAKGGAAAGVATGGAGGNAGGGASFTMTPEVQAAREALRKACDPDMKKLCPGQEGREGFMCLRENTTKA
ncbi:MAG TPA: efflux RND transporter periplasmic adaptor subunit, partial [Phenylobacterium sp.]|nr:efflux RND transporter periplasmic adaptor subunit [Phenylobacterium sp.]